MTIQTINTETILHRCDHCGATREIAIDALTLGVEVEGYVALNFIRLPPCEQCPTTEFLIVSDDVISETSPAEGDPTDGTDGTEGSEDAFKSSNRLLVDQLGEMLLISE